MKKKSLIIDNVLKKTVPLRPEIKVTSMKAPLLILLQLLICALPVVANAQDEGKEDITVSGVVTSSEDGMPLIGVVVMSSAGGGRQHGGRR